MKARKEKVVGRRAGDVRAVMRQHRVRLRRKSKEEESIRDRVKSRICMLR